MTGYVGERRLGSVLGSDRQLQPIADLLAQDFPAETFAIYLGNKVIVRGIPSPGDSPPRMKVRSTQTVRQTCVPQQKP